jgi:hypothetical protein
MPFRKRKRNEPPQLDKLLEGYRATAPPSSPTPAVASVHCWKCKKPNIYDARRSPPTRCVWCRAIL